MQYQRRCVRLPCKQLRRRVLERAAPQDHAPGPRYRSISDFPVSLLADRISFHRRWYIQTVALARRKKRRKSSSSGLLQVIGLLFVFSLLAEACDYLDRNPGVLAVVVVPPILVLLFVWVARQSARLKAREALLGLEVADLDRLNGLEFEAWISAVLQNAGFRTEDTPGSGDYGADVVAEIGGTRFAIQAKRWRSNVGNSAVQEANAGADYYGCGVAVVVTQSRFTRAAISQAERLRRPCVLIGRGELPAMARSLKNVANA